MAGREQIEAIRRRKLELSEQLAVARATMTSSKAALKDSLDVKRKISRKVRGGQAKVLVGSALATLAVTLLLKKKRPSEKTEKKGFGGWVKGLIVGYAIKKAKALAIEKAKLAL